MNQLTKIVFSIVFLVLASGCVQKDVRPDYDYTAFRAEDPKSILVIPAVNRSVQVDAPDFFLSTISRPAAERGYYVFPVHMVKRILEDDGLSDAYMVHQQDPVRLAALFGADAVLYVAIEQWTAKYVVLATNVTVEMSYILKSGKTGEELWNSTISRTYDSNSSGGSSGSPLADLIVAAISAGVTKAKPNYVPLSTQANAAVASEAHHGVPAGPYHPMYKKDAEQF